MTDEVQDVLLDSRRLTGASLLLSRPGAILETRLAPADKRRVLRRWSQHVAALYLALGWCDEEIASRDQGPTQMLAATAPPDQLMSATFVLEQALNFALRREAPSTEQFDRAVDALLGRAARRCAPRFAALSRSAARHRAQWLVGERDVSIGEGDAALIFADDDLPLPDDVDWQDRQHRLPTALITGTNGKTTTARILARILTDSGRTVGFCCTDYVQIGTEIVDRDDYSGPTGARMVLRDARVQAAVLELARGGMLRRGVQVRDADVGVVTNVAADHLGDGGIHTLEQLAEAKFTLLRGLHPNAPVVVNADDRHCTRHARRLQRPLYWFARKRPPSALLRGAAQTRALLYCDAGELVIETANGRRQHLLAAADLPIAHGGTATHNLANALAASAAALALGIAPTTIAATLRDFGRDYLDNPGRANLFRIGGASVLADYGHNPEGLAAVFAISRALPHQRLLISFGQAGDRSDKDLRDLADQVAAQAPARVLIKDIESMLRGRARGEIPRILAQQLRQRGVAGKRIQTLGDDRAAVEHALAWLRPGDLAVLFIHADSAELLAELAARAEPS